jgi:hypothetical protein
MLRHMIRSGILVLAMIVAGMGGFAAAAQEDETVAVNTVLCTDATCDEWETLAGATLSAVDSGTGEVIATCTVSNVAAPEGCALEIPAGADYRVTWDTSLVPDSHSQVLEPFTVPYAPVHPDVLTLGFAPPPVDPGNGGDATGNTLEIKVWICPAGTEYGQSGDFYAYYYDTCSAAEDPTIEYQMTDANGTRSQPLDNGWATFTDVAAGPATIRQILEDRSYGEPVIACNDGTTMDAYFVEGGEVDVDFTGSEGLTLTCDWFNMLT